MSGLCARLRNVFGPSPPDDDTTTKYPAAIFRPRHMSGLYRTESTTGSTVTGRDSAIVAHVDISKARDANQDHTLQATHNSRLLVSNHHLLHTLRADEARENTGSERPFSDYVSNGRGDLIKEIEEEYLDILKETIAVQTPADYATELDKRRQFDHQAMFEENRKLHHQLNDHKKETFGLQNYRLHSQRRIAELEVQLSDHLAEITDLKRRINDYKQKIVSLNDELVSVQGSLKESIDNKKAMDEQDRVVGHNLAAARTEIDHLRRRRWF